jgi:nucleoside 2-deoxyribosyltransferase
MEKGLIYLASSFRTPLARQRVINVAKILRSKGFEVFVPMDFKVPNAWDISNIEWARKVADKDKEMLDKCDIVVCMSYGIETTPGTSWEAGYAYGTGKKVIFVEMNEVEKTTLMFANHCHATLKGIEELINYDFKNMPSVHVDTEQT